MHTGHMNTKTAQTLIARRASKGYSAAQSHAFLAELVATFSPSNLGYALHYNGFATERACERVAAELLNGRA